MAISAPCRAAADLLSGIKRPILIVSSDSFGQFTADAAVKTKAGSKKINASIVNIKNRMLHLQWKLSCPPLMDLQFKD